jgi:hypothetical protein
MGVLSDYLVALEQRALVLASADSALEQWKWFGADGVCTASFGCFSTGAKGGGFCTTGLAQVRFSTGAKGTGIGAIGFSYGAMEQWALVYAQLV